MITLSFLMTATIMLILMALIILLAKKVGTDREKPSPFECGFEPISSARMPFSLRFFLIAVIFLIFDVEISLLLPIPLITHTLPSSPLLITTTTFIIILTLGLYYEWKKGALNWS